MPQIVAVGQLTINDTNDGLSATLTNEGMSLPAGSDGVVISYLGCSTTMYIYLGGTDDSPNWAVTATPSTGVVGSFGTGFALRTYTVTSLTENSAYVDFEATKAGYPTISKRFSLSIAKSGVKGDKGQDGVGTPGAEGISYMKAYCASTTQSTTTVPPQTIGKNSLPPANSGGLLGIWVSSTPSLNDGQRLFQSDGSYNPATDKITWNVPYWSSLKVGTLGAWVVDTGDLNISGTMKTVNDKFKVTQTGQLTARAIDIQTDAGVTILSSGMPLNIDFAAPGTKNSDLTASITAAQTAADNANTVLADIANDNKLTSGEKSAAVATYEAITAEQASIETQATALGITTEKTNYTAAITALTSYLNTSVAGWNVIPGTAVTIVGQTFRDTFKNVYTKKQTLLNKMAEVAATKADWNTVVGRPDDALNLIRKSTFEDGTLGGWGNSSTVGTVTGKPWTKAVQINNRDNYHVDTIAVSPGETLYFEGDIDASLATSPVRMGFVQIDKAGTQFGWTGVPTGLGLAAGTGWTKVSSSAILSATTVKIQPWISINATSGTAMGTAQFANLRISRFQSGATLGAPTGTMVGGTLAETVASNAAVAKARVDAMANDNTLDRAEKIELVRIWQEEDATWAQVRAQAITLGVSYAAYDTAHNNTSQYLIGLSPGWSDTSQDTTIDRTAFRGFFQTMYTQRAALQAAIATKVNSTAVDAAKTSFLPIKTWDFRGSLEGWVNGSGISTFINNGDSLVVGSSGTDPIFRSPAISIIGNRYNVVRMKLKRTAGSGWDGNLFFSSIGQPGEGSGGAVWISDPTKLNEWVVAEWNMSSNTNWMSNTITGFRPDLGNTASDVFEIDWISLGKYGAPISIEELNSAATSLSLSTSVEGSGWTGGDIISGITDGKTGSIVRRSNNNVNVEDTKFLAVDRNRTYRARWWARAGAGTNGTLYFCLRQFLSDNENNPHSSNGGHIAYKPGGQLAHTDWREYSETWSGADFATGTTHIRSKFLLNYPSPSQAGYWEVQGFILQDVTEIAASSGIALRTRGSGITLTGSKAVKTGGTAGWNASVESLEGHVGGAFASARIDNYVDAMFGLNTDPYTDADYPGIDFAIYPSAGGNIECWESAVNRGIIGTYVPGDVLSVTYDGTTVRYQKNGTVIRSVAANVTNPLYFDSSIYNIGNSISSIRFGPMSSNSAGVLAKAAIDDATTGLNARMRNNAENILGGYLTVNAVNAPAGLRAGTLQWNNAGARTSGYGVAVTPLGLVGYNSAGTQTFAINASDGNAYFGGTLGANTVTSTSMVAGAVTAGKIAAGAVSATSLSVGSRTESIVPDPMFNDPAWWNHTGLEMAGNFEGSGNGWKSNWALRFSSWNPGSNVFRDVSTPFFPLTLGATYRVEFQVFISSDFNGMFTPVMHLPNQAWFDMGSGNRGWSWVAGESGLPVAFDINSPKGLYTYSATFTATNVAVTRTQFRFVSKMSAGYCEFGGVSIVRVSDNVLIKDGAITANKMTVTELSAITARVGTLTNRPGNWGQGLDITSDVVKIFDGNNIVRVKLGYLG